MQLRLAIALVFLAFLAFLAGCASDDRPAAASLVDDDRGGGGGGVSSSSSSSSGGASAVDAGACTGIPLDGEAILERPLEGDAPLPFGGTPAEGTYLLMDRMSFGAPASASTRKATLIITSTTIQRRVSDGASDTSTAATYTKASDTTLALTPICPAGELTTQSFSAQSQNFTLYLDASHLETYARQ